MTRRATDKLARMRSQRRILAAGIRMRGQWRYLVRSLRDPFTLGAENDVQPEGSRPRLRKARHASIPEERV
ncbi:MAG: hypothetical protein AB1689_09095 [Thermodesulfobacteriota bacterium]